MGDVATIPLFFFGTDPPASRCEALRAGFTDFTGFGLNRKGAKYAKGFLGFFRIGVKPIRKRQRLGGVVI